MADASCLSVPSSEGAAQPQPAKLRKLVEDLQTTPSQLQPSAEARAVRATTRPAEIVVPESSYSRVGSTGSLPSQLHSFATTHPSSPLAVLSAAAFSLKDKTHQVAQQQKRALSAFQQKGGLVGWLHGESDDIAAADPLSVPASPTTSQTCRNFAPYTPPNLQSTIEPPMTEPAVETSAGRRRSLPNVGPGSMFDNLLDKVTGASSSQPLEVSSPGHSRVHSHQAGSPQPRPKTLDFHETTRQRAATTDSPRRSTFNDSPADDKSTPPALLKAQSAASLRPPPETRFSLDDVLSDEWSSCVLWAHLYSSGRDPQHHLRLSFLIETTFRITPLYRKLAAADATCSDKDENLEKLVNRLKLLHSRYLMRNGAATSGVPVASPVAIHAKNQLALMVHSLTSQKVQDNDLVVEKAVSSLLQLAREVEREFLVLCTRSYVNFADTNLYRDFITREPSLRNIAVLLRAARIPFYQQPNSIVDTVSLNSLVTENEATNTVFSRADCQVFVIVAQPEGPIQFTDISPGVKSDNSTAEAITKHAVLQQTIEPFLNPAASVHPAASKPLAFNFTAGTGSNQFYGAVMWLASDLNDGAEGRTSGFCIISKFPLVDTMRHYLSSLWTNLGDKTEIDGVAIPPEVVVKSSQDMVNFLLQREASAEHPDSALLPTIDFRLGDLFDCLSLTNILRLFAFVLLEKKIVLVASSYTVLFSVSEALRALIYPLVWSHVYVPVLPLALKDCLQCPTPFIFGLHDSYVRRCAMPRPSSDLVVVNLDRDSLTGGGDVFLPPVRQSMLREELFRTCKPHLLSRDSVDNFATDGITTLVFPSTAVRRLFLKHLREILTSLEPCFNRFDLDGQHISVVDNAHSSQWPADTARFCSAMLHTQAISTYLAAPSANGRANVERAFV